MGSGFRPLIEPPSIFTAVREQLGFRLDAKKKAVDVLVIGTLDRTPHPKLT